MSNIVLEFNCATQELVERPMTEQELQAREQDVEPPSNVLTQDSLQQQLELLKSQIALLEEKLPSMNATQ